MTANCEILHLPLQSCSHFRRKPLDNNQKSLSIRYVLQYNRHGSSIYNHTKDMMVYPNIHFVCTGIRIKKEIFLPLCSRLLFRIIKYSPSSYLPPTYMNTFFYQLRLILTISSYMYVLHITSFSLFLYSSSDIQVSRNIHRLFLVFFCCFCSPF